MNTRNILSVTTRAEKKLLPPLVNPAANVAGAARNTLQPLFPVEIKLHHILVAISVQMAYKRLLPFLARIFVPAGFQRGSKEK